MNRYYSAVILFAVLTMAMLAVMIWRNEALAKKKKYGMVFLTPEGRAQAERYAACCSLLRGRMQQTLGLNEEDARSAACAVLAQLPDALPQMMERLSRKE